MKKSTLGVTLVVAGLLLLVAIGVAADWLIAIPVTAQAEYVGRQSCAQCHQPEFHAWTGSHHDKAMDLATEETVLADFDDATISYEGITSKMFRRDGAYFINTEGPDGEMADFEIKYVFGFDPLQQFMIEFPDGRVQVLRISWDTHGKRWFYLYPPDVRNEKLKPDDPLHWTGVAANWNHMCADCHSTNLQKNYDVAKGRYDTSFAEMDVSCEACHGPGSIHVDLAQSNSLFWDRNHGYGLPTLKHEDSKYQIETCAKCHARRHAVHPDFRPGQQLLDYYAPALLREGLYHADGQILDEVYVYGSFVQSKMHAKGIRCTDCHNPHTTELKQQGNLLCTSCHQHAAGKYDVPAHHHHKPDSPGAQCVECHMPSTHYMIVDPRRDHSLRVPRPDLSIDLGTPNACTACHLDTKKSDKWEHYADWLAAAGNGDEVAVDAIASVDREMLAAVEKWYGKPKKKTEPHYAYALHAAREGKPEAEEALTELLSNKEVPSIVKATAIQHLADLDTPSSRALVIDGVSDSDPLVRAIAIMNLQQRGYSQQRLVDTLAPLLDDPVRMVRTESAQVLAPGRALLDEQAGEAFEKALAEYRAGQFADRDQAAAHFNLGNLAQDMNEVPKAVDYYETALKIDPQFFRARFNLGMLYSRVDQDELAAKQFRQLSKQDPAAPLPLYRLGLILGRMGRYEEAEKCLLEAHQMQPGNFDYLYALSVFYLEIGNLDAAQRVATELLQLYPQERRAQQLMRDLARRQQRPPGR